MIPVRTKCRPAPSPLVSLTLVAASPAVGRAVHEKLDDDPGDRAASGHVPPAFSFCAQRVRAQGRAFSLKQQRCPRCGHSETLNRHSILRGNDPTQTSGQSARGQRVFCSSRGQRGGCGRTFSILLAEVLPRHTLTATLVWPWLVELLAGLCPKAAAEKLGLPFALESVYRLRCKLRRRLDDWRVQLCREQPPPATTRTDPLLHSLEHLRAVFAAEVCPPAAFQLRFQRPFLG